VLPLRVRLELTHPTGLMPYNLANI